MRWDECTYTADTCGVVRLLSYSDYALRVLLYLGLHDEPGRLHRIGEIARTYGISKNHVMKVVQHLAAMGIVVSVRGRGGGLRLAHRPEAIRVGAVYRRMEGFALAECFGDHRACRIAAACRLRDVLDEALEQFLVVLDRYTLADLLREKAPMRELLTIRKR